MFAIQTPVFKKMLSKAHSEKDFNIKHNFFCIQTKGQETKAKESELDIWVCLKCRCHPWIIKYHWPVNYMWKTQMTFMIYQKEQHRYHRSQSRSAYDILSIRHKLETLVHLNGRQLGFWRFFDWTDSLKRLKTNYQNPWLLIIVAIRNPIQGDQNVTIIVHTEGK